MASITGQVGRTSAGDLTSPLGGMFQMPRPVAMSPKRIGHCPKVMTTEELGWEISGAGFVRGKLCSSNRLSTGRAHRMYLCPCLAGACCSLT